VGSGELEPIVRLRDARWRRRQDTPTESSPRSEGRQVPCGSQLRLRPPRRTGRRHLRAPCGDRPASIRDAGKVGSRCRVRSLRAPRASYHRAGTGASRSLGRLAGRPRCRCRFCHRTFRPKVCFGAVRSG
jgi:hypothetical protein